MRLPSDLLSVIGGFLDARDVLRFHTLVDRGLCLHAWVRTYSKHHKACDWSDAQRSYTRVLVFMSHKIDSVALSEELFSRYSHCDYASILLKRGFGAHRITFREHLALIWLNKDWANKWRMVGTQLGFYELLNVVMSAHEHELSD